MLEEITYPKLNTAIIAQLVPIWNVALDLFLPERRKKAMSEKKSTPIRDPMVKEFKYSIFPLSIVQQPSWLYLYHKYTNIIE